MSFAPRVRDRRVCALRTPRRLVRAWAAVGAALLLAALGWRVHARHRRPAVHGRTVPVYMHMQTQAVQLPETSPTNMHTPAVQIPETSPTNMHMQTQAVQLHSQHVRATTDDRYKQTLHRRTHNDIALHVHEIEFSGISSSKSNSSVDSVRAITNDDSALHLNEKEFSGISSSKSESSVDLSLIQTRDYYRFNCSQLQNIHNVEKIGSGITKTAFRISVGGELLIAKRVKSESPDKRTRMGVYKLLKEAHILHVLHQENPNAMRVRGVCIFSEDSNVDDFQNGVTVLYETQSKHEHVPLDFKPWIDFLRRLHMSSLGSIVITDTKINQFTMLRTIINMHDMDDAYIQPSRGERSVRSNCNQIVTRLSVNIDVEMCISMVMKE